MYCNKDNCCIVCDLYVTQQRHLQYLKYVLLYFPVKRNFLRINALVPGAYSPPSPTLPACSAIAGRLSSLGSIALGQ